MAVKSKQPSILMVIKAEESLASPDATTTVIKTKTKRNGAAAKKERAKMSVTLPKVLEELLPAQAEEVDNSCEGLATEKKKKTTKREHIDSMPPVSLEQPPEQVKVQKILPPIPQRTPEERQALIDSYNLEQKRLRALLPKRIAPGVGQVADNIAPGRSFYVSTTARKSIANNFRERLLAEPSIAVPTWEVLADNSLSVRQKIKQLYVIGWEPELIELGGHGFCQLMILARIMEKGIA